MTEHIIHPTKFCCRMREHFLIGIIGQKAGNMPADVADFVIAWHPKMVMAIKFCPFCGRGIEPTETLRTSDVPKAS